MHQKNDGRRRPKPVSFTLNGQTVVGRLGRDASSRPPSGTASRFRASATWRACGRTATAAPAWWRSRASACWRRPAAAIPRTGWRSPPTAPAPLTSQKMSIELLLVGRARDGLHAQLRARSLGEEAVDRQAALRARAAAGRGPLASGDGREPRRLHPVQALRARLPRRAGQRRHRLRLPRRRTRRSCSTSTIRWATRPASPAASACRRARPAR